MLEDRIKKLAINAAKLAIDKKATDTVVLELTNVSSVAEYFVICSGENPAQLRAIANVIDEYFSKEKLACRGREGRDFAKWILLDYGDIIINIFNEETRGYYDLDKMWIDAPRIEVQ
ncbi:MAG: ribosome silencing factor [Nitrospira sp.]|nr:ribosome silencing factor [bacterium]MBL7049176.1 ribosome silencing factor [Nitrospira sp.]